VTIDKDDLTTGFSASVSEWNPGGGGTGTAEK
jgi:hypothetical protein